MRFAVLHTMRAKVLQVHLGRRYCLEFVMPWREHCRASRSTVLHLPAVMVERLDRRAK